jgi:putative ABC transport system ATP-binding protein
VSSLKAVFLVVLGGNGSGKSTLLSALAGNFRLDEGEVHLAGQNVTHWAEHRRARLIGRVFQNPFMGTAPRDTTISFCGCEAAPKAHERNSSFSSQGQHRDVVRLRVFPGVRPDAAQ